MDILDKLFHENSVPMEFLISNKMCSGVGLLKLVFSLPFHTLVNIKILIWVLRLCLWDSEFMWGSWKMLSNELQYLISYNLSYYCSNKYRKALAYIFLNYCFKHYLLNSTFDVELVTQLDFYVSRSHKLPLEYKRD